MLACQEVTFLSHSNLFIGFADYQREKIFIDDSFFQSNGLTVAFSMVYQNKLLTLQIKVRVPINEKERGNRFHN